MFPLVALVFVLICLGITIYFSVDTIRINRNTRGIHANTYRTWASAYRSYAEMYALWGKPEKQQELLLDAERCDREAAIAFRDSQQPLWKVWV